MTTTPPHRLPALDFVRGVAVMGILVANLPGFALPKAAYWSPLAGEAVGVADRIAWTATFVLVEGKMRGLFSFLFGASVLLVLRSAGRDAFSVHYLRMFWLFVIGAAHLYLLWWGDILTHYALVGVAAALFAGLPVRGLLAVGAALIGLQTMWNLTPWLYATADPAGAAAMLRDFGGATQPQAAAEIAAMRGSYADTLAWRVGHNPDPFGFVRLIWPETLGYMLFGMAGLKSGFLSGAWERRRYLLVAAGALGGGWAAYALFAALTLRSGFDPRYVLLGSVAGSTPVRPVLIAGYAAAALSLMRPGGWLTTRVEAVGRAAFTNYLGTTLVMTTMFQGWGLGLFAEAGRAELLLFAPPVWALMLLWSKPWLDRYRYGPLEWLWRSLSRLEWQPMRR